MMQNIAIENLTSHNIRPSVQRIAVYSYLLEKKNHPTVDMIYTDLHPTIPTLSKTTVYNTLKLFLDNNLVQTIIIEDEQLRFDADTSNHIHFKCTKCNQIYDIFTDENISQFKLPKEFTTSKTQVNMWGLCPKCTK